MVLTNITSPEVQELILLGYESNVKMILLFGWWLLSMFYIFYLYENQKPTSIFLLGTFRAILYITCYMWAWLFWLLYPVYSNPYVAIDTLLLFLSYSYGGIITIFFVMFVFNFTLWIPQFIINYGKFDIQTWEDGAIKEYFGKNFMSRWNRER